MAVKKFLLVKYLVVGAVVTGGLTGATYELSFWNKIYPGVSVAGINLGNLTVNQAQTRLAPRLTPSPPIMATWGTRSFRIEPDSIGLKYDPWQGGLAAYQLGRSGDVIDDLKLKVRAWRKGVEVEPTFVLDENRLIAAIASVSAQIDIPARQPQASLVKGRVMVSPSQDGRRVDDRLLFMRIKQAVAGVDQRPVEIPVVQLRPGLNPAQIETLKKRAQQLVGSKIVLTVQDREWEITADQLLTWLDPATSSGWKRPEIEAWVGQLADSVDRPAQNAHFRFVRPGKVEEFKPAQTGLVVQQTQLVSGLLATLNRLPVGEARLPVPVVELEPEVTTSQVNNLGISELLSRGESRFAGSIPNRVFNITKATGLMNGILVGPGETFSFNKYVGDISEAGGYKQAYIIKEGRTILGDGGGVCQVSTTLFRAVLAAGLPVVERWAHAYRVHFYELDRQPGFDATIFTPNIDLRFKNDTPAYLLIQASADEKSHRLVFELYGTSDGRKATLSPARVWDLVAPPPDSYQDDPTLAAGKIKQVDWKAWGAKAAFDWKVTRGGEVLQDRTFYSNFRPWQAVFLRGTRP